MTAVLIATVAWAPPVAEWPGSVATSASQVIETAPPVQIEPRPDERPPTPLVEQPSAHRYAPVTQKVGGSEPDLVLRPARKPRPAPEATPTPTPTPEATPTPAPKASPTPARERPPKKAPASPEKRAPESPRRPEQPPAPQPPAPQPPAPEQPAPTYSGTSRFWYPALGMKAAWRWYGCEYGGDPNGLGGGVYRWGCAPKRNVYLMSHVWSTFKAVRRGFHSGAMKTGQSVWYADNHGDVSKWKVKWIKRVTLDYFRATSWDWAVNDSARPIMTLQTCDGRNDEFRIIVRLVPSN